MPTKYTLNVSNNSTQTGTFCIFQKTTNAEQSEGHTLAWLAKTAHPTTQLNFQWDTTYNFVWAKTSTSMEPGSVIKAGQAWDANLSTLNQVKFDYSDESYTFADLSKGEIEGNLYIEESERVLPNDASVGIGMSGKGTFLVPSKPNMKVQFTPRPSYWLIFGDFQEGEVLDLTQVKLNALKLEFDGTTVMNVEFNADNTWHVLPN